MDGMNRKDMRAWEKVYGAYYAALCSYAAGILRDDEAAKDVVQEVMIKVWMSTQVFATVPDFTAYLYKSVYNNSVCYLRTEANRARILREMPVETVEVPDEHFERMVEEKFAILDAGMTDLIRPALYQAYHKIENISSDLPVQTYDVVGPVCESSDVFGKAVDLNEVRRGDFMAIRSAGAYGEIMASVYNCRELPQGYTSDELG